MKASVCGLLALFALCAHGLWAESTIYKCAKADGSTVFSPTPCGKDAKEIGVPKASDVASQPSNNAIRDISDSVADIHCRDTARSLYVDPDTSAISRAKSEIAEIQSHAWVSANNPAAAQLMANEDATRVVGLRNLIATEQARVDGQRADSRKRADEALAKCAEEKRRRDEQHSR
jgi:hypothetical protein